MIRDVEVIRPCPPRNRFHHVAGLAILALNSARHRIQGYRNPRPHPVSQVDEVLAYDQSVMRNWTRHLQDYLLRDLDLAGREVLELGPGPDLGTGLLWLAAGAKAYTAVDAFPLARTRSSLDLHEALARRIAASHEDNELERRLLDAVHRLHDPRANDLDAPLRYRVIGDFDLSKLAPLRFDLLVSHSAFEHFHDVDRSFAQLSPLMTDRAHLVAEVDLQTHTRWIRDADPLNIYRYSRRVYRGLGFSGIPNRIRPDQYLEILERHEWCDLRVYPRRVLETPYVAAVEPTLSQRFRGDLEQLGWLSIVVCASRKGERSWKAPQP